MDFARNHYAAKLATLIAVWPNSNEVVIDYYFLLTALGIIRDEFVDVNGIDSNGKDGTPGTPEKGKGEAAKRM